MGKEYKTIAEIIARMEEIIAETTTANDRRGYFAALYKHVTYTISEGIKFGKFEDGPRMVEFDVIFASRYLYAYDAWEEKQKGNLPPPFPPGPLPKCWEFAFDTDTDPSDGYAIMQHMMLSMSAHICLDLAITVSQVAENWEGLQDLEYDYGLVEEALSLCVPLMDCKLDSLSPTYKRLSEPFNIKLVNALMALAREAAWVYAVRMTLLREDSAAQYALMRRMDLATKALEEHFVLLTGPIYTRMERMEEQMGLSVGEIVAQIASTLDVCYTEFETTVTTWGSKPPPGRRLRGSRTRV